MLRNIRVALRLMLFFLISLFLLFLLKMGNIFLGIYNEQQKVIWKNKIIRSWALITSKIIGLKTHISGTPPEPPFFIVANHLSYVDVIPLWLHLKANFVAMSEIKTWPFFGSATKALGILFIKRELKKDIPRVNELISFAISKDQGLILFPESTSSKGAKVLPFKASLLEYPTSNNMPIHYAAISYASNTALGPTHLRICWWGDMPFFSHFWNLLKIREFEVTVIFGRCRAKNLDLKILAKKLHKCLSDVFVPVVQQNGQSNSI